MDLEIPLLDVLLQQAGISLNNDNDNESMSCLHIYSI